MSKGTPKLVERKLWTAAELDADLTIAVQGFRDERLQEPLAAYLDAYDKAEEVIEELLRRTDTLANVQAHVLALIQRPDMLDALCIQANARVCLDVWAERKK